MFQHGDIYNSKTVHKFFDGVMKKHAFDELKEWLRLIEDIVDLRECFFNLMHGMFFLYVV